MRFLFVSPGICLHLPSDSTSRWTPLVFGYILPAIGRIRDFHPLERALARRTQKGAAGQLTSRPFLCAFSAPLPEVCEGYGGTGACAPSFGHPAPPKECQRRPPGAKKRPASHGREAGLEKKVRAALLSHALERTIIAAGGLNGRVRDGNGCSTPANGTNQKGWQPARGKDFPPVPWEPWTFVVVGTLFCVRPGGSPFRGPSGRTASRPHGLSEAVR